MKRILVLSAIVLLFMNLFCSSDQRSFKKAKKINNVQAYKEYLENHSDGVFVDSVKILIEKINLEEFLFYNSVSAGKHFLELHPSGVYTDLVQLKIDSLMNERHLEFINVKTVKIEVEQSYGEAKNVYLPYEDIAELLFRFAGLNVVYTENEDYDSILKIKAFGKPLKNLGLYTGASLEGRISFFIDGNLIYRKRFSGHQEPASYVWYRNDFELKNKQKPSAAPFIGIFNSSFREQMIYIVRDIFGEDCLKNTLKCFTWIYPLPPGSNQYQTSLANISGGASIINIKNKIIGILIKEGLESLSERDKINQILGSNQLPKYDHIDLAHLVQFLKYPIISNEISNTLDSLQWRPINLDEKVAYLVAKKEWTELRQMGREVIDLLLNQFEFGKTYNEQSIAAKALAGIYVAIENKTGNENINIKESLCKALFENRNYLVRLSIIDALDYIEENSFSIIDSRHRGIDKINWIEDNLIQALKDKNKFVRGKAAIGLLNSTNVTVVNHLKKDQRIINHLKIALSNEKTSVKYVFQKLLEDIQDE